jgi:hypothetical protein
MATGTWWLVVEAVVYAHISLTISFLMGISQNVHNIIVHIVSDLCHGPPPHVTLFPCDFAVVLLLEPKVGKAKSPKVQKHMNLQLW